MRFCYPAAVLAIAAPLLIAAEFWESKEPSKWSDKDVKKLLTHSPWAKDAAVEFNMERMAAMRNGAGGGRGGGVPGGGGGVPGGGGGPGGGGMGRGGSGGMGGPGMGGGEPQKIAVHWESSMPMREAAVRSESPIAKSLPEWSREYYVITTTGGRMMGRGRPQGGGPDQPPDDERRKQMIERMQENMKAATSLKIKGKDPIPVARIETFPTEQGNVTAFLFPRTAAISADDKEVSFETALGPMEVKAKFVLKEMVAGGKLEL